MVQDLSKCAKYPLRPRGDRSHQRPPSLGREYVPCTSRASSRYHKATECVFLLRETFTLLFFLMLALPAQVSASVSPASVSYSPAPLPYAVSVVPLSFPFPSALPHLTSTSSTSFLVCPLHVGCFLLARISIHYIHIRLPPCFPLPLRVSCLLPPLPPFFPSCVSPVHPLLYICTHPYAALATWKATEHTGQTTIISVRLRFGSGHS